MRRIVLLLLSFSLSILVNAQFYGGFYHADPNAWFDKEPYFACQNAYSYNGWGQNIQNVTIVVNQEDVYYFPYTWEYGKYIIFGKDSGVEFSSGDVVALYWGNQYIGSWTYKPSSALSEKKFRGGSGAGKVIKKIWKYVKKIR